MSTHPIDDLLDRMTLDEQVSLLSGEDFWSLPAIPRLGIGKLRVTDGPNGARGGGSLIGGVRSAAFPVGIALGATWNPELVRDIGAALAQEAKSKGAHMLLAPTINIQRSVTNGRNFECYSEDPVLTASLAAAYVAGLQAEGIAATVKHFVGNESEIERTTMSSAIDERTLREVYLLPFERAVKESGAWGVMTAYNRINGIYASEQTWLIEEVLRGQWGFEGLVMSDWFGSHTTTETVNAGLDLEMPGPTRHRGRHLIEAVESGAVEAATVRARARTVLRVMARTGALTEATPKPEQADDRPEHRALIRQAGAEAAVLLRNAKVGGTPALPLARPKSIAVIGPNAATAQIMGGGSAQLNPHYRVSPLEGLQAAFAGTRITHAKGCTNHRFEPLLSIEMEVEYYANVSLAGAPVHRGVLPEGQAFWIGRVAEGKVDPLGFSARLRGTFVPQETATHRLGVISAGFARVFVDGRLIADAWSQWTKGRTFFEEGCDEVLGEIALEAGVAVEIVVEFATRPYSMLGIAAFRVGIALPLGDAAIEEAVRLTRSAEVAVVLVGRNAEWDTEGSDLAVISLPGRQDELVRAVANANPYTIVVLQSGGPVEMPWLDDVAAVLQAWYPGQEAGNSIADVLGGWADPGGRLAQTFPRRWSDNPTHSQDARVYPGMDGIVEYREGIFVGHRHYERHGISPLFPFGFGLSYTDFSVGALRLDDSQLDNAGTLELAIEVTNIGARAGSTVLQAYVAPLAPPVARPVKELKAFAKVHLAAGASTEIRLVLGARDFAYFDADAGCWTVSPGPYRILVGTDAETIVAESDVVIARPISLRP